MAETIVLHPRSRAALAFSLREMRSRSREADDMRCPEAELCSRCGTVLVSMDSSSIYGGTIRKCPNGCHDRRHYERASLNDLNCRNCGQPVNTHVPISGECFAAQNASEVPK